MSSRGSFLKIETAEYKPFSPRRRGCMEERASLLFFELCVGLFKPKIGLKTVHVQTFSLDRGRENVGYDTSLRCVSG